MNIPVTVTPTDWSVIEQWAKTFKSPIIEDMYPNVEEAQQVRMDIASCNCDEEPAVIIPYVGLWQQLSEVNKYKHVYDPSHGYRMSIDPYVYDPSGKL